MIIYNTTFHIENEALAEYLDFLKTIYIPTAIRSGRLSQPLLQRVLHEGDDEGVSLCLQFRVGDRPTLQRWIESEGAELNRQLVARFGYRVAGFSTLLDEIEL